MARLNKFQHFYAKNKLVINLVLLTALFFIHCFWGNMMFVAFPILLLFVIIDNIRNGFSYILFSIPFCMMNLYWSAVLFCICVVAYMIKFFIITYFIEKNKPNKWLLIFMGIFFIYCLLPIGSYNGQYWTRIAIFFCLFAAFGMIIQKPNVVRLGFNFKILALALLISCVFSATFYFSPYMHETMVLSFSGGRGRYQGLVGHPNVLAMFCELLMAVMAYFILAKKASWKEWFFLVALTAIGFFTLSKTFLALAIFMYLVIFIVMLKRHFVATLITTCLGATMLIILGLCFPKIVTIFVDRFIGSFAECKSFADFMNMVTTGRYDLWVEYLTFLSNNPLRLFFGCGLGAGVLSTLSAHNMLITGTYELGIVGMILLGIAVGVMIKEFRKNSEEKVSKAIWLPIVIVALIASFEDLIFYII